VSWEWQQREHHVESSEGEFVQPENAEYFRVAAKNSDFDRWAIGRMS
jgi:hypothetical protein